MIQSSGGLLKLTLGWASGVWLKPPDLPAEASKLPTMMTAAEMADNVQAAHKAGWRLMKTIPQVLPT